MNTYIETKNERGERMRDDERSSCHAILHVSSNHTAVYPLFLLNEWLLIENLIYF
jgi:hypothetical protein